LLATLHFIGNRQAVLQGHRVSVLRFGQQLLDFLIEQLHRFLGMRVAHRGVLAGVGQNLGSVDRQGDVAHLEHLATCRHLQDLREDTLQ